MKLIIRCGKDFLSNQQAIFRIMFFNSDIQVVICLNSLGIKRVQVAT